MISYFTKNNIKNPSAETYIYNSNNNILNINKKLINKHYNIKNKNNRNINKSRLENIFDISKSSSSINNKDLTLKNREIVINQSKIKKVKFKKIIKKLKKLNNSGNKVFNINHFSTKNKNMINNSPKPCFKCNIKTIENNNSSNKNIINQLKKRLNINQNNTINNESNHLKRFSTEKELELNKYLYPLKDKKNYQDKEFISMNSMKSFELKKNEKISVSVSTIFSNKKNSNSEINEYKISPLKHKNKKSEDIFNDFKKNKIKKISIISNTNLNKKNNKNYNLFCNKKRKKEKKNLSLQFNHNSDNERIKNCCNTIENNNIDIYSSRINKIFHDLANNNFSRNKISKINENNSHYLQKSNIKINKRKTYNIDFDNKRKESKKTISKNKKELDSKKNDSNIKNNKNDELIQINYFYKLKTNNKHKNKMKYIKIKEKNKINERNKDKNEILSLINFFEKTIDEDIQDISKSSHNLTRINAKKIHCHFMNLLKDNSKIEISQKENMPFLSIFKESKIITTIINYCCYDTLNKLCLINKQHYKYIKPYIYKKIKIKIMQINNNGINVNNIIKNSLLKYSPLSKLSPTILQKKYIDLLYELNEKYDDEIKKDLLRTSPNDISFQYSNENYNKLYHILSAYSNYNKNIGYAQGLNFLAANCIYIYKNEIDAFIFLDSLILKFNLERLFGINNNELNKKLNEIECILNKWCPEVNEHLQKIFLNYDFFIFKWMITLFSNDMNIKYLFQLWDYMIIFGWKFFRGFVISVIKCNKNIILNSSLETITKIMNDILKTKDFEDNFDNIINNAFKYINEEDEIL